MQSVLPAVSVAAATEAFVNLTVILLFWKHWGSQGRLPGELSCSRHQALEPRNAVGIKRRDASRASVNNGRAWVNQAKADMVKTARPSRGSPAAGFRAIRPSCPSR